MSRHLTDPELIELAGTPQSAEGGPQPPAAQIHLRQCGSCRRRLEEYRSTLRLAASLPAPRWSDAQAAAFARRLRPRRRHPTHLRHGARPGRRFVLAAAALAALAAVFFGAPMAWRFGDPPDPTPTTRLDPGLAADSAPLAATDPLAAPGDAAAPAIAAAPAVSVDDEMASWIDDYLIDTATEDELWRHLDSLGVEQLFAVLDR